MAWSPKQIKLYWRACHAADWHLDQRYVAMAHVGCPLKTIGGVRRPSVKHQGNTNLHFEMVMELAEMIALGRGNGAEMPKPSRHKSWRESLGFSDRPMRRKLRLMFAEAQRELPGIFNEHSLRGFIARMTKHDSYEFSEPVESLDMLDAGQLYRVIEGARAWIGRELLKIDVAPTSFTIPPRVRKQLLGDAA